MQDLLATMQQGIEMQILGVYLAYKDRTYGSFRRWVLFSDPFWQRVLEMTIITGAMVTKIL